VNTLEAHSKYFEVFMETIGREMIAKDFLQSTLEPYKKSVALSLSLEI